MLIPNNAVDSTLIDSFHISARETKNPEVTISEPEVNGACFKDEGMRLPRFLRELGILSFNGLIDAIDSKGFSC